MVTLGLFLLSVGIVLLICAFIADEGAYAFMGLTAIFLSGFMLVLTAPPQPIKDKVTTIQEIEYAMNKCSSFGGLKEFRNDVIICMDKTEINMNFEPEKKVEAE